LSQLRQQEKRLSANDVEVVVVTFEAEEQVLNYQRETGLHWPVAVDGSRALYDYFGMTEAGFFDLWNFATLRIYLLEMLKGNWLKRSQGDVRQRGGDVLIDPQGMVRLHHVCKGPADRLPADNVSKLIEKILKGEDDTAELQKLRN
jgi:hypothetical protein